MYIHGNMKTANASVHSSPRMTELSSLGNCVSSNFVVHITTVNNYIYIYIYTCYIYIYTYMYPPKKLWLKTRPNDYQAHHTKFNWPMLLGKSPSGTTHHH